MVPATVFAAGSSYWNVAGTYGINVEYLSVNYQETLILTQARPATITGTSIGAPCTPACSNFTITSGSVVGDNVTFMTASPFMITFTGTIAGDGSMAGTWLDGAGGLGRNGTW